MRPAELVWAHPEATLFDAVNALRNSGIGSLAVYDPDQKAVLGLLQHHHIFQFLAHNFRGDVGYVLPTMNRPFALSCVCELTLIPPLHSCFVCVCYWQ